MAVKLSHHETRDIRTLVRAFDIQLLSASYTSLPSILGTIVLDEQLTVLLDLEDILELQ